MSRSGLALLCILTFDFVACAPAPSGSGGDNHVITPGSGGASTCLAPPCDGGGGGPATGGNAMGAGGGGGVILGSGGTGGLQATGGSPGYDCNTLADPNSYAYDALVPPSQMPPGGLSVQDTPLFVAIGWDDNRQTSGLGWTNQMLKDQGLGATFFHTSSYFEEAADDWKVGLDAGFEVAVHTVWHNTGYMSDYGTWNTEITGCLSTLTAPFGSGGLGAQVFGSRAPYLEYNDAMLKVLTEQKIWYDSSIQEGYDPAIDGTNHYFPYTLEAGSPGHTYNKSFGFDRSQFDLTAHPGLMELPIYALLVPPDSEAAKYGFSTGLRGRITGVSDFEETGYKVTGFDYNLWTQAGVSGPEFLAILKYNFDLRRAGNRAPFIFGTHTHDYQDDQTEHRQAISDFFTYVKTFPEVRVVTYQELFNFMRNPRALSCDP